MRIVVFILIGLLLGSCEIYLEGLARRQRPAPADGTESAYKVIQRDAATESYGSSWIRKDSSGINLIYLEGDGYQRGKATGKLARDLIITQEKLFVERIRELVPNPGYLKFLRNAITFFNKNLNDYVLPEYRQEILGISEEFSDDFDYVGPKYLRILNYHAAHDIGHAVQNMNLVGCTAFSVWDEKSYNEGLLVGRTFDFYAGDEFAKEKLLQIYNPDQGFKFAMVGWAGFIGAVSGMNQKGLTVTLNAARSGIPLSVKTPVSLIAREVLQYASNIKEAREIIERRPAFVAESFLVCSAADGKCKVIEKTPDQTAVYEVSDEENHLVLTNHFQSPEMQERKLTQINIAVSPSKYRHDRVNELLREESKWNPEGFVSILRNRDGLNGRNIGMGNELAVNQLIAHHAVVFEPDSGRIWVSEYPFQLGAFRCFDLRDFFQIDQGLALDAVMINEEKSIPPDRFLESLQFARFRQFVQTDSLIQGKIAKHQLMESDTTRIEKLKFLNPAYFQTWLTAGMAYYELGYWEKALEDFEMGSSLAIPKQAQRDYFMKYVEKCRKKLKRHNRPRSL